MQVVGEMEIVRGAKLAVSAGIPQPPFELPCHHLDSRGHVGPPHLHFGPGVHLIDREEQQRGRRNDRPHHFERVAAMDVSGRPVVLRGIVLPEEPEEQDLGDHEHDPGQRQDEVEERVDLRSVGRDVLGQPVIERRRDRERRHAEHWHGEEQQSPEDSRQTVPHDLAPDSGSRLTGHASPAHRPCATSVRSAPSSPSNSYGSEST